MPTPYDLRSGPVLLRTMNYLITNIMDRYDQEREKGDWYNFLWDRLRAIRKVIEFKSSICIDYPYLFIVGINSTAFT